MKRPSFVYMLIALLALVGFTVTITEVGPSVSIGPIIVLVAFLLILPAWLSDKIMEPRQPMPMPPVFQETKPMSRYAQYLAELEGLKARGEVSEKTYHKLKDEYGKKFVQVGKRSVSLPPPPSPAPEVSGWAKATVATSIGVRNVWSELKLLIVGTLAFYVALEINFEWFNNYYVPTEWLTIFRFIMFAVGWFSFWYWITNQAKWEPKITGGRWIALALVGVTACLAVIIVVAIVYMPQIIELIRFLGSTGASGNFE